MSAPEFVAIGHVTLDRFGDEVRPGGAALYSAVTAHRLGLSAGILTSHAGDFPLDAIPSRIEVVSLEAPANTVFEYEAAASGERRQKLTSTARALAVRDLPEDWRGAPLALLAPVAQEVDPRLAASFDDGSVGAAAQGWLRAMDEKQQIVAQPWPGAREVLNRVLAVFVSADDLLGHESQITEWVQRVPIAVVTAGAAGALLYVNGERYEVRPRRAREVDPTGAGDVFAATFLVHYQRHPDPWEAAEAATCAASLSVEGEGWSAVPDTAQLERALAEYRARS
jgi:sugar/nucleoside kinase (ribokinase family)